MLCRLLIALTATLGIGLGQSMSGMDHMHTDIMGFGDIHSHHRCCQHDKWHGMLYETEGKLANGSMTPEVHQKTMFMDYDYTRKMERINITSFDYMTQQATTIVVWRDYNAMMTYSMVDDKCYAAASNDTMSSPCIPADYMYGGSMMIGSGMDTIKAHSWQGMKDGMSISLTVTEGDCTLVTMGQVGETPDGTKVIRGLLFSDIHQGSISSSNAFDVPMDCRNAPVMPIGK